jgi:NitT/TauT family transport system substrate-binding protein
MSRQVKSSRKRYLAMLGAVPAALAFRPVRVAAQTGARTPIIVNITASVDLLPFHYALRQDMFAKAGLDVTYEVVSSGALALVAVVGGATNIGWGNPLSVLLAYAKGVPLRLIAPGGEYLSERPQTELFVRMDSTARTGKDLEGRSVAVTGLHDQSAIGVRAWVDSFGADSQHIRFVEMPPSSMLAALESKRVDAVVVFEPVRSAALAAGARSLGKPFDAISKRFTSGVYFGTNAWISTHRDAVLRYADVLRQAAEYANAHYDELVPLIISFTKMAPEVVQRANRVHFATSFAPTGIQPIIDIAAKYKEIPAAFPAQDIIMMSDPATR